MPRIEKQAVVAGSAQDVFAFLSNRMNAPKLVPNLIRVWDIEPPQPGVGQNWKFEYRLLGMGFEGQAKMTKFEPGSHLEFQTTGKLDSTWSYHVKPQQSGSQVTVAVEYQLPDTLWAKIKDRVAYSRINEAQAEELLTNLSAQFA
jgi:hypothetical protein